MTACCTTKRNFPKLQSLASWSSAVVLGLLTIGPAHAGSQVSISDGGTPSYSLPIAVPPGIAGMAPNLSLLYSGSSVNGPVGYGWTVQGVSMITRCAGNKLIDGYAPKVQYGPNDKLCLDGQRLIQTDANGVVVNGGVTNPNIANQFQQGDALGGTGMVHEYRTDKDMYARIRSYDDANGDPNNGPAYFKVWTKSGQVYEYGVKSNPSANAQITAQGKNVVVAWPVSRISDTVGNYIDVLYEQRDQAWGSGATAGSPGAGHEWNVTEIRYTGNGIQQPRNKVTFEYTDRADNTGNAQDRAETYLSGSKNVSIRRLAKIHTYINWPADQTSLPSNAVATKVYRLSYDNGPVSNRSRLKQVVECNGDESKCLPGTSFNYASGTAVGYTANGSFANSPMSTLTMQSAAGDYGVIQGDFNGDGRLDLIRWSDSPSGNLLYFSNGDGTFTQASAFNITSQNLFKSDGCYISFLFDINGDGLPDILRYSAATNSDGTQCSSYGPILVFMNNGNGSFTQSNYAGPTLKRLASTAVSNCLQMGPNGCTEPNGHPGWTEGDNFFFVDVNGDGRLDIITTLLPYYGNLDNGDACASQVCTHVYLGNGDGTFADTPTNLANTSVYIKPKVYNNGGSNSIGLTSNGADVDGDGLSDLTGLDTQYFNKTPSFKSRGDSNFDPLTSYAGCNSASLDFNGDGRRDCLQVGSTASGNLLYVLDGTSTLFYTQNFNMTTPGYELGGTGVGYQIADVDGDGREDILRWKDDATQNAVYLSNGDGQFRHSSDTSLYNIQLQKSDGSASFLVGDFTGHGTTEILRMVANPAGTSDATRNQLYVKADPTPLDQLYSVTTNTGLSTILTWVPLPNSSSGSLGNRYTSDRGTANAATFPVIDLNMPIYVVATTVADSGVGSNKVTTEYSYAGLKAAYDGRGWLGFRETRRQTPAPTGAPLTVWTRYLQDGTHTDMASVTETRVGALNVSSPQVLSRTTYIYCDKTAAAGAETSATSTAPCPTTAKVQRPYLYQSTEQGWDLGGNVLPTVTTTNTFNNSGDPTQIAVSTTGTALGLSQSFTTTTANQYYADNTAGNAWILGRLQKATVTKSVPNSLGSISTSAGTAPYATAVQGQAVAVSVSPNPLTVNASGPGTASGQVTASASGGVGSYSYSWTRTAGTRTTISSSTAASPTISASVNYGDNFTETWQVTVTDGTGTTKVVSVNTTFTVPTAAGMNLTGCSSTTPTTAPSAATMTCTLSNTGQTGATSISYSTASGTTVSGPTGACAAGATCGTVTVTTSTAAGTYSGTLTATPNVGSAGLAAINLQVNTPAALSLGSCSSVTPTVSPSAATMTCTLSNTGQTGVSSISYATPSGTSVSGPTGACAANASCGNVTVTTATSASTYSGTLTATPNSGSAASIGVNLTVNSPPALSLSGCSSVTPTVSPTAATMTCALSNTGQTGVSSISYSTPAGTTISGPTGACAGGASCGSVTVTTGTSAGTYSGTMTATPSTGSAASVNVNLTVQNPAALSLSGCSSVTPTIAPTAATMTCSLSNTGQVGISSISYTTASGTTVSGPTGACAGGATCGSVTVTTPTTAGTYSGTLAATPNTGSGTSTSVNLQVNTPVALALTNCSSVTPTTSPTAATMTCTLSNSGQTSPISITYATASGTTVSGPSSCAGGTSCGTVTVTSGTAPATYSGTLAVTPNSGTGATASINLTVNPGATTTTLALNPTSLAFGTVAPAVTATLSVTVTNQGSISASGMTYKATKTSGPGLYSAYAGTCGTSLAAGASCTVNVDYDAACGVSGTAAGNLTVSGTNFSSVVATLSARTGTGVCN